MKISREEFKAQQTKFIKEAIVDIEQNLLGRLESALNSGAVPEHWIDYDVRHLTKSIVDSFCKDSPYSFVSREEDKHNKNLHKFI